MDTMNPTFEHDQNAGGAFTPPTAGADSDNLKRGCVPQARRCMRQTRALTKKNLLLSQRNMAATFAQVWIGVVFLFLLLIIGAAIKATAGTDKSFVDTKTHVDQAATGVFPDCTVGPGKSVCYNFAYGTLYPNNGTHDVAAMDAIVDLMAAKLGISPTRNVSRGIMALNPNASADAWMLANQNTTKAVILFENSHQWNSVPGAKLRYTLVSNTTYSCATIGIYKCDEPWLEVQVPLMSALHASFVTYYGGDANTQIQASFSNFPHPDAPTAFDSMVQFGALFLYIAFTFQYVIQMTMMVREKEHHLVESMKLMGLMNSSYWGSWLLSATIINTLMVFLLMLFGVILQFDLFLKTSGNLLLLIFWLTAEAFTAMAFFFSALVRTESTARLIGVGVFVITFIAAPLFYLAYFQDPSQDYDGARWAIAMWPYFNFYVLLSIVIDGSAGSTKSGYKWENIHENILPTSISNTRETYWSVNSSLQWMVASFFLFTALAWYLDQIIPTEHGRRLNPLFPFMPSYYGIQIPWPWKRSRVDANAASLEKPDLDEKTDVDVREEATRVHENTFTKPQAVVLRGVKKHFGKFKAVNNVFYSMNYGELTAILGHNGSGKSTTFNMLTGLTNVTGGEAEIFGRSIRGDMSVLHATMGVCPQHDVLWDQLTSREHLELFATLKGLTTHVGEEAQRRIDQVKLASAADSSAGSYSGGMRRRLSIAIAMLGEPSIVFLDEPTTGMDPVTRAEVLEMISQAKQNRVIVLTSHAMEEVEMLADKVVVMSRGKVQAVGSTLRLKKRFGQGYTMTLFVEQGKASQTVVSYVRDKLTQLGLIGAGADVTSETDRAGNLLIRLPHVEDNRTLVPFFRAFEQDKTEVLDVKDYSLGLSTLEEVFLNLSKSEEERENERLMSNVNYKNRMKRCEAFQPKSNAARTRVSLLSQLNALFWKNLVFQLKNFSACCNVVSFPIVILAALIVLNNVLFVPLRIKAMCGDGVSASDCPTLGYDLNCIANLYEFRPVTQIKGVTVGKIDLRGNRGLPVNANCGAKTCFVGLEKTDTHDFPISYDAAAADPGYVNHLYSGNDSAMLAEWYADALFILANTTCQTQYNNNFDQSKCPDGSARQSCIDQKRRLANARDYLDASQRTTTTFGPGACAPNAAQSGVTPPQEDLDQVKQYKTQQLMCDATQRLTQTYPLFNRMDMVAAMSGVTRNASGFLDKFTLSHLTDPDWIALETQVWKAVNLLGAGPYNNNTEYTDARSAWMASIGLSPDDFQYVPRIGELCTAQAVVNATTVFPFQVPLQQLFLGSLTTYNNFCAVGQNMDALRAMSTQSFAGDRAALDLNIYKSWFGTKVQTPYMRERTIIFKDIDPDQDYRVRHFYAKFGAYHVKELSPSLFKYVAYMNKTANSNVRYTNWKELVYTAESAFVRDRVNRDVEARFKDMPKKFQCNRNAWLDKTDKELKCDLLPGFLQISIIDFVAGALFPYIFFLYAFLIVNQIVYEKENRLRVIMRMNGGLKNWVYWFVTGAWFFFQYLVMVLLMFILGNAANLRFTSLHDPFVFWIFVVSWGLCLVAFSFVLSVPFSNAQASTAGMFLFVLIVVLVGEQIMNNLVADPYTTESSYASIMWLPPFVMIRIVTWMAQAGAFGQAIKANELSTFADGAIATSIGVLWVEFFACLVLLWYLDNTYVAGFGTRRPWLFCLNRRYWTGEKQGNALPLKDYPLPNNGAGMHSIHQPDVVAEHERVVDETRQGMVVRVVRLRKEYDNGYVAVKSLSLGIDENECFGMLGHNGAGKTTAINMLVGLNECSAGTALVDGLSINTDMEAVQTRMGVCPQHDVVWGSLSVRDHLLFYARLKGVQMRDLSLAVDRALFDVNLMPFEHRAAQKLSGGMRRRLSTAMSLIGTPRVVYLDEPSTGLDPASKRALWSVIEKAKGNKSLVLTTHSMEEAEVLCDRLGVMALGELQCIGTAAELKNRFGAGYTFFLQTDGRSASEVNAFMDELFPGATPKLLGRPIGGTFKYEIKREFVVLSRVFDTMESDELKARLKLVDWSLTETTLEEVFLKLAELAHVDEALSAKPAERDMPMCGGLFQGAWCRKRKGKGATATAAASTHNLHDPNVVTSSEDNKV